MWDVLGMGCIAVDDLIYVEHYPVPDTKMPALEVRRQGGGNTANALVAAARQGASAAYCAGLGADALSTYSLRELEAEGIECSPCHVVDAGRPFHSFIIAEHAAHTRTIVYETGQIAPPPEVVSEVVGQGRVLMIDHYTGEVGCRAVRLALERGVPVVADVEVETAPGAVEMLEEADHLIIGRALAARFTEKVDYPDMLRALARPHRACCVITAGEAGCWFAEQGGPAQFQAAFPVAVVDSTGCGDVFHGVYAAAVARGENAVRAIELASAAAAIKATSPGARAGIPFRAQVDEFLKDRKANDAGKGLLSEDRS
jgi:sulfofructose kinase